MPPRRRASPNSAKCRSEEHTSELQSLRHLVCRLLLERYGGHRDLLSFPTRRSSDLGKGLVRRGDDVRDTCHRVGARPRTQRNVDRKSTRLNSSHLGISYAVFCLKDTAATEIYSLSLHDALPIWVRGWFAVVTMLGTHATASARVPELSEM